MTTKTKNPNGRPTTVRNGKATSIYLNEHYKGRLKAIGGGYGAGVRKLVDLHDAGGLCGCVHGANKGEVGQCTGVEDNGNTDDERGSEA